MYDIALFLISLFLFCSKVLRGSFVTVVFENLLMSAVSHFRMQTRLPRSSLSRNKPHFENIQKGFYGLN